MVVLMWMCCLSIDVGFVIVCSIVSVLCCMLCVGFSWFMMICSLLWLVCNVLSCVVVVVYVIGFGGMMMSVRFV